MGKNEDLLLSDYFRRIGRKGGKQRVKNMSAAQRSASARKAAAASAKVRSKKAVAKSAQVRSGKAKANKKSASSDP